VKIGIVGAGQVGATAAYSMMMRRVGSEIMLVDRNTDLAVAQARDILDATREAEKREWTRQQERHKLEWARQQELQAQLAQERAALQAKLDAESMERRRLADEARARRQADEMAAAAALSQEHRENVEGVVHASIYAAIKGDLSEDHALKIALLVLRAIKECSIPYVRIEY